MSRAEAEEYISKIDEDDIGIAGGPLELQEEE